VFCLLVVLVKLSVLAKWLTRKTALKILFVVRILSQRSLGWRAFKSFFGLVYCFIVLLCVCLVCRPYTVYFILLARYSLFVLKVPLNTNQLTNLYRRTLQDWGTKQTHKVRSTFPVMSGDGSWLKFFLDFVFTCFM